MPFGAFVELGDSIEGLVHISEMAGRHIDTPAQVVHAGDDVKVKVMEINPDRRRISLSMKAAARSSASRSTWTNRCRPVARRKKFPPRPRSSGDCRGE